LDIMGSAGSSGSFRGHTEAGSSPLEDESGIETHWIYSSGLDMVGLVGLSEMFAEAGSGELIDPTTAEGLCLFIQRFIGCPRLMAWVKETILRACPDADLSDFPHDPALLNTIDTYLTTRHGDGQTGATTDGDGQSSIHEDDEQGDGTV
jgi:hypothetical protein